jgi:class 3 adenylate cyclase
MRVINEIFDKLKEWVTDKLDFYQPLMQSRVMLFYLLTEQKAYLAEKLGLTWFPPVSLSSQEFEYTQHYLRWYPHLPHRIMWEYDQTLDISSFGTSQTVVVYGDIRRSQDLMTYTIGPNRFEEMMIRFLESVRSLFNNNLGIFDKFTGDGFLGYFNEYLCGKQGEDFLECFIRFSKQCMETCCSLFNDWKKWVRKLPEEDIMLSIGADVGQIHFGDRHGHLVCIGDAIVWAQRMCAAAPAGTIYINNMLANLMKDKKGIEFSPVAGKTKTGESFLASIIRFI